MLLRSMLRTPDCSSEPFVGSEGRPDAGDPPKHGTPKTPLDSDAVSELREAGERTQAQDISREEDGLMEAWETGNRDHPANSANLELARMVVQMHDTYMEALENEKKENMLLRKQQQNLQEKMHLLEQRMQTHLFLMEGFIDFMAQVREGRFRSPQNVETRQAEISRYLESEHLVAIETVVPSIEPASESPPRKFSVSASPGASGHGYMAQEPPDRDRKRPTIEIDISKIVDEVGGRYDRTPTPVRALRRDVFNRLPPTPNLDEPPIRSTGLRATKRKNKWSTMPRRAAKKRRITRQTRAQTRAQFSHLTEVASDGEYCPSVPGTRIRNCESEPIQLPQKGQGLGIQREVHEAQAIPGTRLRARTSWRAVNDPPPPVFEGPGNEADSEYDPEFEPEEDHNSSRETSRAPSPALSTSSLSDPPTPTPSLSPFPRTKPRYSAPRQTGLRYASGPPGRRFKFLRMSKTVAQVWSEWKYGHNGNPPIEELEVEYGTGWRTGNLKERKYASNYVTVRQIIVRGVENLMERGMGEWEACETLDEIADGRMQLLIKTIRDGDDPLTDIPRRFK